MGYNAERQGHILSIDLCKEINFVFLFIKELSPSSWIQNTAGSLVQSRQQSVLSPWRESQYSSSMVGETLCFENLSLAEWKVLPVSEFKVPSDQDGRQRVVPRW